MWTHVLWKIKRGPSGGKTTTSDKLAEIFGKSRENSSDFHGEFPKDVFQFPNIKVIDLSNNVNLTGFLPEFRSGSFLQSLNLHGTGFSGTLPDSIGSLKSLNVLVVSDCNFSGAIPSSLVKLSQLTYLSLSENNFYGQLPSTLGNLTQLTTLDFSGNNFRGELPSTLMNLAKLTRLRIVDTELSGKLPSSLGNLVQLELLSIGGNRFSGQIPFSLGNLSRVTNLKISGKDFDGQLPTSLSNLTRLDYMIIADTSLSGPIPSFLFSVPTLRELWLENNEFTGPLAIQNVSSSKLRFLSLRGNNLNGQIPSSISKLTNLYSLSLASNNFSGALELDMIFQEQSTVRHLDFSHNRDISIKVTGSGSTLPKFYSLIFSSCCCIGKNIPHFLRTQDELIALDISNNKIEGNIPSWLFDIGIETMTDVNLSHNSFSSWEHVPSILPWKKLEFLDLRSNTLQGPLIAPPLSTKYLFVSENKLTGGIHPLFCNLSNLIVLDVSKNLLNGTIPQCLGSFSSNLLVLNMKENNFQGRIPQTFTRGSNLQTLDLSHNKLRGKVPQSLINCRTLEVLNLGHNQINDVFPLWLQNLPQLQVLVLRSNKFHGPIWHRHKFLGFLKLRILDLSFNNFSGNLSPEFFKNWSAINVDIRGSNKSEMRYMKDNTPYYQNSVTVTVKGQLMEFVKILTIFTSIDLSNNNIYGEIPSTTGDLKSLIVLNLSSNNFEGLIPPSFGNLTEVESLDLSKNKLSGRIPQELVGLTFLEYLNLSDNRLSGPIPQNQQFGTFTNSSFAGNSDLCGLPLSKKCQSIDETPSLDHSQESESENGFGWKAVLVGYGCGLLVGAIGGHVLFSKKPNLLVRIYRRKM